MSFWRTSNLQSWCSHSLLAALLLTAVQVLLSSIQFLHSNQDSETARLTWQVYDSNVWRFAPAWSVQVKVNKACLNNRTPCVWQVFPSHVHQRIDKPTATHSRHESCATQTLFQYWEFQTFASEQVALGKINFCVKRKKNPDCEIRG